MKAPKERKILALLLGFFFTLSAGGQEKIDAQTGLVADEGLETVKTHCLGCHSAKLIIQSRATRQGWRDIIRWMQRTQNLWEFDPETETILLDYLAEHYAPETLGRRPKLHVESWYFLEAENPLP
jgi:hypothetical protein